MQLLCVSQPELTLPRNLAVCEIIFKSEKERCFEERSYIVQLSITKLVTN